MTFPPEVWDGVLRRLQKQLAPVSYEMWLPQIAARCDGHSLELGCPTQFHCDRIRDYFLSTIEAVIYRDAYQDCCTHNIRQLASNRRARHEYHIHEELEAGLVLTGTEVKAARSGTVQLKEAHVEFKGDQPFPG